MISLILMIICGIIIGVIIVYVYNYLEFKRLMEYYKDREFTIYISDIFKVAILCGLMFAMFWFFSPLNEKTVSNTYQLSEIQTNNYYTMNSGNKISILIKTDNGIKKKSFNENITIIKQTNKNPYVKIKYKDYKAPLSKFLGLTKQEISVKIYISQNKNNTVSNTTITCSYCNTKNDTISKYCKNCGKELTTINKTICQYCHTENDTNATYCKNCGEKLN